MASIDGLQKEYKKLDQRFDAIPTGKIDPGCLLTFTYEYPAQKSKITLDTHEFTALCPWTSLPDHGLLEISYVPQNDCIELKSLKYYLLSFRETGIVQEHAANRILKDLVEACNPDSMNLILDYKTRGGLHTVVTVNYPNPKD